MYSFLDQLRTNNYGSNGLASTLDSTGQYQGSYNPVGQNATDINQGVPDNKSMWDKTSDWFGKQGNMNMLQGAMGLGQMGLGLASYLQQSKYLNKQGQLLDQQISNNSYEMNQRKRMNQALDSASANRTL